MGNGFRLGNAAEVESLAAHAAVALETAIDAIERFHRFGRALLLLHFVKSLFHLQDDIFFDELEWLAPEVGKKETKNSFQVLRKKQVNCAPDLTLGTVFT